MQSCLFSTTLNQFRNRPLALFDARFHCRRAANRTMNFSEVVIREIECDRSLKILNLFAESIGETGQPAAVHVQGVILLFNMAG